MFQINNFSIYCLIKNAEMTITRNFAKFNSNQLFDSNITRLYLKKTEQKKK